jgi:hypothetical protein
MRYVGQMACIGKKDVYRVLVGNSNERDCLKTYRHRREHNIDMDLKEIERKGVD